MAASVRRRWHVVVGDRQSPTIRVDTDSEDRARVLCAMYGRRHGQVEVVHVVHTTGSKGDPG